MNPESMGISETAFAFLVEQLRRETEGSQRLTELLAEQHIVYQHKSLAAVNRMRGYIYFSFSHCGTSPQAMKYLYEEMESGDNAYTIAAAAVAIRYSEASNMASAAMLMKGLSRAIQNEGFISFASYHQQWPLANKSSAVKEVLDTIFWLGSNMTTYLGQLEDLCASNRYFLNKTNAEHLRAVTAHIRQVASAEDCCRPAMEMPGGRESSVLSAAIRRNLQGRIALEDQDGIRCSLKELNGKPTLIAFFYTRCENPAKCSLTISNLASIQKALASSGFEERVNIVAISYDTFYDKPALLKSYGSARGLDWHGGARMFRVLSDFKEVQGYFDLDVNFSGSIVNRHAIALYLLDKYGGIWERFERSQTDVKKVAESVICRIQKDDHRRQNPLVRVSNGLRSAGSFCFPLLYAFFPKCPFCLAAYLSLFGVTGLQLRPLFPYLLLVMPVLIAVNFYALYRMGRKRHNFKPLFLCASGFLVIIAHRYLLPASSLNAVGLVLMGFGVLLNHFPGALSIGKRLFTRRTLPQAGPT